MRRLPPDRIRRRVDPGADALEPLVSDRVLDDAPRGLRDGQKAADIYVTSDALVGVEAILAGLDRKLGVGKPTTGR